MKRSIALFACLVASSCTGAIEGGGPLYPGAGAGMIGQATGAGSTTGAAGVTFVVTGAGGTPVMDPSPPSDPQGGASGAAGSGSSPPTQGCLANGVPADVQAVLTAKCVSCHGNPPIAGVPASLTSYAALTAPSKTDPTRTMAQEMLVRLQSSTMPMPPAPLTRATNAEMATIQQWVAAGAPKSICPTGTDAGAVDAGAPMDAGPTTDPFSAPSACTSKQMWTGGNRGSGSMNPGLACIACHSMGRGPGFAIAGTLYPTGHEPDLCNGANGTTGAKIVIVGADGQMQTLTPNGAGNFYYQGTIAKPYQAKIVYMGRERAMIEPQTSGDCNNCHTQNGSMPSGTQKAPGRIVLP
jgi:hypothetical protein